MIDKWNEKLRCPRCKNTGMANLSQAERAEVPTVEAVPAGFVAVHTEFGPDLRCGTCKISAAP